MAGGRVGAHDYSPWELLTRVIRAWKGPLVVAGLALVVVITVVTLGGLRLAASRERAVAAEAETRAALVTVGHQLSPRARRPGDPRGLRGSLGRGRGRRRRGAARRRIAGGPRRAHGRRRARAGEPGRAHPGARMQVPGVHGRRSPVRRHIPVALGRRRPGLARADAGGPPPGRRPEVRRRQPGWWEIRGRRRRDRPVHHAHAARERPLPADRHGLADEHDQFGSPRALGGRPDDRPTVPFSEQLPGGAQPRAHGRARRSPAAALLLHGRHHDPRRHRRRGSRAYGRPRSPSRRPAARWLWPSIRAASGPRWGWSAAPSCSSTSAPARRPRWTRRTGPRRRWRGRPTERRSRSAATAAPSRSGTPAAPRSSATSRPCTPGGSSTATASCGSWTPRRRPAGR
jgi:hypothetical protein